MKLNSTADTSFFFKEGIFLCARAGLHPFLLNPQKILESKNKKEKVMFYTSSYVKFCLFISLTVELFGFFCWFFVFVFFLFLFFFFF